MTATAAIVSFRLGGHDGVSVVAERWREALVDIGFDVTTVAGEGPVDRVLPALAIDATEEASVDQVKPALDGIDLVIVENLLTIPLNIGASRVVAEVLQGRPAILHHHDPPWQRQRFADVTDLPPDDPHWRHVVVNELTLRELRDRHGIEATYIANAFDVDAARGDRPRTRDMLQIADDERLLLHPVRAIERKNVPAALALAEAVAGTYWLTGPPEEGYEATLDGLLAAHVRASDPRADRRSNRIGGRVRRVRRGLVPLDMGGVRQPSDRGGDLPTPGRRRHVPGRGRDAGSRVPLAPDGRSRAARRSSRAGRRSARPRPQPRAGARPLLDRTSSSRPQGAPRRGRLVAVSDPILVKRARAAKLANLGQRLGYLGFVIAIVVFVIGAIVGFNGAIVGIVIGSIVVGSIFLAPSIVLGYAVKAAEKEDRAKGR